MKKSFNLIKTKKEGVKTMKRLILITGLLIAVLSVPIFSEATPVNIINPGFESDTLPDGGWTVGAIDWSSPGAAGVLNPPDSLFTNGIPEGFNIAYINGGAYISQILTYTLLQDTLLTLTVDVGYRLDGALPMPTYEVQLMAGGNLLTSGSTQLQQGAFVPLILTYNITDQFLGQNLEIRMLNYTSSRQVNFDNVSLNNDTAAVPEPSTLLLLGSGLVGLGYFIRRRKG